MEQLVHGQALGAIMQVAYVVEDIEQAMLEWTKTLRVGPFFYLPHFPLVEAQYRGKPIDLDIDVALAFSGSTCFELISQRGDQPSPFREATGGQRFGFHHWATATPTFDEDLARLQREGSSLVASAKVAIGGRVSYLEKPSLPGMIELIELTPGAAELFAMIHGASRNWDGRDPIRRLG